MYWPDRPCRLLPMCLIKTRLDRKWLWWNNVGRYRGTSIGLWVLYPEPAESADTYIWGPLRNIWVTVDFNPMRRILFVSGGLIGRKRSKTRFKRGKYRIPASNYPMCIYRRRWRDTGDLPF